MGKSLIEEVLKARVAPCPACFGKGYVDTDANQAGATRSLRGRGPFVPLCKLCQGGGRVYLDKTCCCGYAAVIFNPEKKFWYCGRESCKLYKANPMVHVEWVGA